MLISSLATSTGEGRSISSLLFSAWGMEMKAGSLCNQAIALPIPFARPVVRAGGWGCCGEEGALDLPSQLLHPGSCFLALLPAAELPAAELRLQTGDYNTSHLGTPV